MKKIYRILFLLVALIGYSSCNYLDIVPDETTTDEDTYADKDAVRDYLILVMPICRSVTYRVVAWIR